jgi:hypothetical protein
MLREVRVKAASADEYPTLVPGRWYTAAAIAGLVKGTRIVQDGRDVKLNDRVLPPAHFEFRGGSPRRGSWLGLRTRRLDRRATAAAGLPHSATVP